MPCPFCRSNPRWLTRSAGEQWLLWPRFFCRGSNLSAPRSVGEWNATAAIFTLALAAAVWRDSKKRFAAASCQPAVPLAQAPAEVRAARNIEFCAAEQVLEHASSELEAAVEALLRCAPEVPLGFLRQ